MPTLSPGKQRTLMAKIVSFINLKGGVGKTTLTVNIAAALALSGKSVLLLDLDPQTNATVSVIPQELWNKRQLAKQTLYHLFRDKLEGTSDFDLSRAIMSDVGGVAGLSLLPSSIHLVEIQDRIPQMDSNEFIHHVDVVGNALTAKVGEYDYILVDCPPNLGAITLNGINMSEYFVVPTVPDILSKIGIDLIFNRIDRFKEKKQSCRITAAGIVFTKIDRRTNLHSATMRELREGNRKRIGVCSRIPSTNCDC